MFEYKSLLMLKVAQEGGGCCWDYVRFVDYQHKKGGATPDEAVVRYCKGIGETLELGPLEVVQVAELRLPDKEELEYYFKDLDMTGVVVRPDTSIGNGNPYLN